MSSAPRRKLLMDRRWSFHPGEPAHEAVRGHMQTYLGTRAGGAPGPAAPAWDDSAWEVVSLPHDFAVDQPFDPGAVPNHGFKARGIGWYRRRFRLDPSDEGRWIALEVGGVATHCTVWLNGTLLRRHHSGYAPFIAEISALATFGKEANVLAVRVDAEAFEGWWYEGAGIYRHVWLHVADSAHVAPWGVFVCPERLDRERWDTRIRTRVENISAAPRTLLVRETLAGPEGRTLGSVSRPIAVPGFGEAEVEQTVPVRSPALWGLESPALHLVRTELVDGDTVIDAVETSVGFRTFRFDPQSGFSLNDKPLKIKGTCNHQDHAGVGVAVPDSIHEYRIRKLKELGSNAYRCAHNPPAEELLDACDRLGMLVMDENRMFSPEPGVMADLETMVMRDRNHPSVILWSIFNEEVLTQGKGPGRRIGERMVARVRALDPSRPVTAAINGAMFDDIGVAPVLDVIGINYSQESYDRTHARYPGIPLLSTENTCAYATRGEARTDERRMRWSNFDDEHTEFGDTARTTWRLIADRSFIAGCFVWTGFDYRGEPAPHVWPCASAHLGILDTCGYEKDGAFLYRALWRTEPLVHILPHWTRHGMEGEPIRVMCFTNCEEVELHLNGKSLGRRPASPFEPPEWSVPWEIGELRAEGIRGGTVAARDRVETADEPARVRLRAERGAIAADGEDALPVTAWAEDASGRAVPTASCRVSFAVEGPARVIGVGNGDPLCHEPDHATSRSLFNGLCQAIVQSSAGGAGRAVLVATSPGLEPARLTLECRGPGPRPSI